MKVYLLKGIVFFVLQILSIIFFDILSRVLFADSQTGFFEGISILVISYNYFNQVKIILLPTIRVSIVVFCMMLILKINNKNISYRGLIFISAIIPWLMFIFYVFFKLDESLENYLNYIISAIIAVILYERISYYLHKK